jgi:hypothetical protein
MIFLDICYIEARSAAVVYFSLLMYDLHIAQNMATLLEGGV